MESRIEAFGGILRIRSVVLAMDLKLSLLVMVSYWSLHFICCFLRDHAGVPKSRLCRAAHTRELGAAGVQSRARRELGEPGLQGPRIWAELICRTCEVGEASVASAARASRRGAPGREWRGRARHGSVHQCCLHQLSSRRLGSSSVLGEDVLKQKLKQADVGAHPEHVGSQLSRSWLPSNADPMLLASSATTAKSLAWLWPRLQQILMTRWVLECEEALDQELHATHQVTKDIAAYMSLPNANLSLVKAFVSQVL